MNSVACYDIDMATKKSAKIQDAEIVRVRLKKQQKGTKKSKLEEALELSESVKEAKPASRKGMLAERFGIFCMLSYLGVWFFGAAFRFYAYSGQIPGYSASYAIQFSIAMAPAFFSSVGILFFAALLWSRLRKNDTRMRRVNILAACTVPVMVSIFLLPVGIGAILYMFGFPLSLIVAVVLYIRQRSKDRHERECGDERLFIKKSRYWNLALLIVIGLITIANMVLTEFMADYIKLHVQRFEEYAQTGTA